MHTRRLEVSTVDQRVAGQTHVDPVVLAISAASEADDVRSGIVIVDLGHTTADLDTVAENDYRRSRLEMSMVKGPVGDLSGSQRNS
jgi:hypothetical protein